MFSANVHYQSLTEQRNHAADYCRRLLSLGAPYWKVQQAFLERRELIQAVELEDLEHAAANHSGLWAV